MADDQDQKTPEPATGPEQAESEVSPPWSAQTKYILAIALSAAALVVLYIGRNVIALAALAGLISFLVAPAIRFMHVRLKLPRILALLISYLGVFVGVIVMSFLMVDGVIGAVSDIDVTEAEKSLRTTAQDVLSDVREIKIAGYTVDLSDSVDPLLEDLKDTGSDSKDASSGSSDTGSSGSKDADSKEADSKDTEDKRFALDSDQLQRLFGGLTSSVSTVGTSLLAAFMSGIITVLVAIYLNADSNKFRTGLMRTVPDEFEDDARRLGTKTMRIWRGYLYGQLLNSLIVGLLMWLVLWFVGLPGAFVFALILGILNMIPTFGPILAAIPAVLAALTLGSSKLEWSNLTFALLIGILYLIVVQLQANLIAPLITSRAVKLSPATVILGLLVGVQVGGLVGAVLVVPVIATGKEYGRYVIAKLTDRDPFPPDFDDADMEPGSDPEPDADQPELADSEATG